MSAACPKASQMGPGAGHSLDAERGSPMMMTAVRIACPKPSHAKLPGIRLFFLIVIENISAVVDQFVQKVNARQHGERLPEDIPELLRRPYRGEEALDNSKWTDWQVLAVDHTERIQQLETRMSRPFPAAFRDLITRYSFPEFDCGPLSFFSNTGLELFHELTGRLFLDPGMSPLLLEAGYIQIGNPFFPNYDPVCLAPSEPGKEGPATVHFIIDWIYVQVSAPTGQLAVTLAAETAKELRP